MKSNPIIGIVGGVGPYAGLDLNRKIFDQTIATCDQDHLNVILFSMAERIPDRTEFLSGLIKKDVANPVFDLIRQMDDLGVQVVGIPCNTFHAPSIFDSVSKKMEKSALKVELLHMIDEVGLFLIRNYKHIRTVGLLGTNGTVLSRIYSHILEPKGIRVIYPENDVQSDIHKAIYDPQFGIKAQSNPVTKAARNQIAKAARHLIVDKKVQAIILGCTELPLALNESVIDNIPLIDSTMVLARALIEKVEPIKLKPI